jgi:uncharacterized protein YhfF
MSIEITKEISNFWSDFINKNDDLDYLKEYKIDAWSFGNTPEMANELVALVLEGKKTATSSLLRAYQGYEDEIPRVGVYSVICDGSNRPKCVVFYTNTSVCRFNEVTEQHAYEEGEGDRSLDYWRKAHHEFFSNYGNFKESENILCERFEVVHK